MRGRSDSDLSGDDKERVEGEKRTEEVQRIAWSFILSRS
jgi:hypothetical protein